MQIYCIFLFVNLLVWQSFILFQNFCDSMHCANLSLQNIIISSVKARWFIFGLLLGMPNILNYFFTIKDFKPFDIISIANINNIRDSESLYFNPLENWKNPLGWSFSSIEYSLFLASLTPYLWCFHQIQSSHDFC